MSPAAKNWSASRGHRPCCGERSVTAVFDRNSLTGHGCCNLALAVEMQRKRLGFLASFSILAAQVSSKLCLGSGRLGRISLEIASAGVWSGEHGRKEEECIPVGQWEVVVSCGHVEIVIRNIYSCVSTSLSQDVISFLLVGKDRTSPSEPAGLHTLFQESLTVKENVKTAGFTSQKNVPCLQI